VKLKLFRNNSVTQIKEVKKTCKESANLSQHGLLMGALTPLDHWYTIGFSLQSTIGMKVGALVALISPIAWHQLRGL
jgi:hypothetical protein